MEGYTCAYRDTKSPLTPIVPLAASSFTFNTDVKKSRHPKFIAVTPKNHRFVNSQDGKETPFPHKINYLTPTCQPTKTPKTVEMSTPKFLTPSNQQYENCHQNVKMSTPKFLTPSNQQYENCHQNVKITPQSEQKTPNYLTPNNKLFKRDISSVEQVKKPSIDVTPRSRFTEKPQIIGDNCNGGNYKVKYSEQKKNIHIKIEVHEVIVNKENIDRNIITKNKGCHCFKKPSPVKPKTLSPRVKKILQDSGMSKYTKLFETEEIDFQVFQMLTPDDLQELGINIKDHLDKITKSINFWKNNY